MSESRFPKQQFFMAQDGGRGFMFLPAAAYPGIIGDVFYEREGHQVLLFPDDAMTRKYIAVDKKAALKKADRCLCDVIDDEDRIAAKEQEPESDAA